jgi:hypothetical protein
MTVSISHTEYEQLREKKGMLLLDTRYNNDGITKHYANYAGSSISRIERFTPWGEHREIKQCATCGEFHNKNNPPLCFGCATNNK